MPARPLRLGTRASPMALAQADLARDRLLAAHAGTALVESVEIVRIRTTGDRVQDRPLAEIGGKGLFTKELDEALVDGRIDCAVHSLKDVETLLRDGIVIACVLPRDDPRDVFLSPRIASLAALPPGAVVGTSSLRRAAQLLRLRPDLRIEPLRGNAGTRLAKLAAGGVDATLLALCGLVRLGQADLATEILAPETMLPAVGQGALAITCRAADEAVRHALLPLGDAASAGCAAAERAMLAALDGSCRTPIAGLATLAGGELSLEGLLLMPDGSAALGERGTAPIADAARLGDALGRAIRRRAGPEYRLG